MYRFFLIILFIFYSIRHRVAPQLFFQLNGQYFNIEKGIFSKLEMDQLISEKWRLSQWSVEKKIIPESFPVFIKPEWGQNSRGVQRIDDIDQLKQRYLEQDGNVTYIVQEAAPGAVEYEVFYIRESRNLDDYGVLSITEVRNSSDKNLPVNSIHNPGSSYHDITPDFGTDERALVWDMLNNIGQFKIARVGLKADSKAQLLAGIFHIIEINIFLPMPLYLLDEQVTFKDKMKFMVASMDNAANLVKTIPSDQEIKNIFFRKVCAHYRVKS